MERKIVLEHSGPIPILRRGTDANVATALSHEAHLDLQSKHETIRADKCITIMAETESSVPVAASDCDLLTIKRIWMAKLMQRIFPR